MKSDKKDPDSASDQGDGAKSSGCLAGLLESAVVTIAGTIGFIVYFYILSTGMFSDAPIVFHTTLGITLLVPAIGCFVFAVVGKKKVPEPNFESVVTVFGSMAFVLAGLLMLVFYFWAILEKHNLGFFHE